MSHFAHLVAVDVRHHRGLLLVLTLLMAGGTVLTGVRPFVDVDPVLASVTPVIGGLISLSILLLTVVAVPVVVQADALVGTDAFWMTRPIPARVLFAAKAAVLVAVLVIVPVAAHSGLMAAYGVAWTTAAGIAVTEGIAQLAWLAPLMLAAALTRTLPRFLVLCGSCLIAVALAIAAFAVVSVVRWNDVPPIGGSEGIPDPTGSMVLSVLGIGAAFAAIATQYGTRSRLRSWMVAAAGLLFALLIADRWPWPVFAPRLTVPAWTARPDALQLHATADSVRLEPEQIPFSRTIWRLAQAVISADGIDPGWSADVGLSDARLHLEGGTTLKTAGPAYSAPATSSNGDIQEQVAVQQLLGVDRGVVVRHADTLARAVVSIWREDEFQRYAPRRGEYTGDFRVRLTQHEIEAVLPLRPGARFDHDGYRLTVVNTMIPGSGIVSIGIRESGATSMFSRRVAPRRTFYLRNLARREAVPGDRDMAAAVSQGFGLTLFGFSREAVMPGEGPGFVALAIPLRFAGYGRDGSDVVVDRDWLSRAELVVVTSRVAGAVVRTLRIHDFPLLDLPRNRAATR